MDSTSINEVMPKIEIIIKIKYNDLSIYSNPKV